MAIFVNIGRPVKSEVRKMPQPAHDGRKLPDRLVTLACREFFGARITVGKLAELLETSVGMLR